MTDLISQCAEVLELILGHLSPADLGAISRTCKTFNSFIRDNRPLWKHIYLNNWDDPRKQGPGLGPKIREKLLVEPGWEADAKNLVRLDKILRSQDRTVKEDNIVFVCKTIIRLLRSVDPERVLADESQSLDALQDYFHGDHAANEINTETFLLSSPLFHDMPHNFHRRFQKTEEEAQLLAQLHVHHGISKDFRSRTRLEKSHTFARSQVYDLRRYDENANLWGPFTDDGSMRVDWNKMESIMLDIAYNLRDFNDHSMTEVSGRWELPFWGASPATFVQDESLEQLEAEEGDSESPSSSSSSGSVDILLNQPEPPLEMLDPYGVTGTWRRIVCYLDWTDFQTFNFDEPTLPLAQRRGPLDTQEAIRLIVMRLRITRIKESGPEDGDMPVVHFQGLSKSLHMHWDPQPSSRVHGMFTCSPLTFLLRNQSK
jgi:hypothetical protein